MKTIWVLFVAGVSLFPFYSPAAQSAHARAFCRSLRMYHATAVDSFAIEWSLDMTTLELGINGELAPDFFESGYSNSTFVELYDELSEDTYYGAMVVDIPETGDMDDNGLMDFFEVPKAVNALTSSGAYEIPGYDSGPVICYWYRDADSPFGTCVFPLPDPWDTSEDLVFYIGFELIYYSGTLTYEPGATNVLGDISLEQTNTAATLNGPIAFMKSVGNPMNLLSLETAYLTNETVQALSLFMPTDFLRDALRPTNYLGRVEFNDGYLNTGDDDYYSWEMQIQDLNDTDHDGIPDFSDHPASVIPPRRPELTLARGTTNLWLTLAGDVGHTNQIQQTTSLTNLNWSTILTVKQTNDPQTISLPLPPEPRFWRAFIP